MAFTPFSIGQGRLEASRAGGRSSRLLASHQEAASSRHATGRRAQGFEDLGHGNSELGSRRNRERSAGRGGPHADRLPPRTAEDINDRLDNEEPTVIKFGELVPMQLDLRQRKHIGRHRVVHLHGQVLEGVVQILTPSG